MCVFFVSLRLFQKFDTFRILVCGGDGSVGWVLSEIDTLTLHKQVQTFDLNKRWPPRLHGLKVFTVTVSRERNVCFVLVVSAGSSSSGDGERSGQGSGLGFCLRRRHAAASDTGETGESQHQDARQVTMLDGVEDVMSEG